MKDISTLHNYRCDLNFGPCEMELSKPLMHQDALADTFRVAVCRGNEPVELAGMTVYGYLHFPATRQTLPLEGTADEHYAAVTLTDACYAQPGWCSLVIQLQQGDVRHTVLKADFAVNRTTSEHILLPDFISPSLPELLTRVKAMEEATSTAAKAAANAEAAANSLHKELAELEQDRTSGALKGDDGGFYSPSIAKLNDSTMRISFVASNGDMPALQPADVQLPKGKDGVTPVKGADYWTENDQSAIVQDVIAALRTPVFGRVDDQNNIILTGELTPGEYTFVYEPADEKQTVIGTAKIGTTYTNLLVADTCQLNKRTNSSGNVSDNVGCFLTDYIDLGDAMASGGTNVLHYKGLYFNTDKWSSQYEIYGYICYYDQDKKFIKNVGYRTDADVVTADGDYTKALDASYTNARYIRVSACPFPNPTSATAIAALTSKDQLANCKIALNQTITD